MVSPKHISKFIAPYTKKMVDLAHSYNIPVIKHTDGNIWPIMDILIDTGIDGINPFDPLSGMDLGEGKEKNRSKNMFDRKYRYC